MLLLETLLQDLRYGLRSMRRQARFTTVSILALALGIGVNTAVFTAYKAFVARPLEGRDPDELVNLSLRLQSGATTARFSYQDYDAYRTSLRSFSGVIAFAIDELRLTDAGGAPRQRSQENGTLIGRLGLAMPLPSRTEIASTFIVSENYFSVLGVAPSSRAFHAFSVSELAASPSVLIRIWRERFAGDPAGEEHSPQCAAFTIVGITPADFTGTSSPHGGPPLSLQPLVHPASHKRLMLLATIAMLPAALGRMVFPGGDLDFLHLRVGPLTLPTRVHRDHRPGACLIYASLRHGRQHLATVSGGAFLLVAQVLRLFVAGTAAWLTIARWLTS